MWNEVQKGEVGRSSRFRQRAQWRFKVCSTACERPYDRRQAEVCAHGPGRAGQVTQSGSPRRRRGAGGGSPSLCLGGSRRSRCDCVQRNQLYGAGHMRFDEPKGCGGGPTFGQPVRSAHDLGHRHQDAALDHAVHVPPHGLRRYAGDSCDGTPRHRHHEARRQRFAAAKRFRERLGSQASLHIAGRRSDQHEQFYGLEPHVFGNHEVHRQVVAQQCEPTQPQLALRRPGRYRVTTCLSTFGPHGHASAPLVPGNRVAFDNPEQRVRLCAGFPGRWKRRVSPKRRTSALAA